METALAIVTAVLRSRIENGLAGHDVTELLGGDVAVTALPPDRIETGANERAQVNLFLYQVVPHALLRGNMPGRGPGATALDLGYLVTAYAGKDLEAEILLGQVLRVFQREPIVPGTAVRATLAAAAGRSTALAALSQGAAAGTAPDLRIAAQFLETEAMSRIWSALQARYRPSLVYRVTATVAGDAG
jgi:hypothetical protein